MNRKSFALFSALIVALISYSASTLAQTKTDPAVAASSTAQASSTLGLLPASDFVAFVNVSRFINEAIPKAFADNPARLAEFNGELDKFKKQMGIDPRIFETTAVGMRYQHPTPNITTTDIVVVARGGFNAGALLAAARIATPGKYREEKYGGTTVYIFKVQDQVKMLGLFNMRVGEVAAAVLGSNTLVIGEPSSVQATLEANKAPSRVNNDLIQLALRKPTAFIGFSSNVPPSLTATADLDNPEISKIVASIRQAYGAVSTTTTGFEIQTVARTEKPEQAQALSETLASLKQIGGMLIFQLPLEKRKLAQNALESLKISSAGNEALFSLALQQSDITELIRVLQPKIAEMR